MSTKKSLYHVAINSQGYILAGTPERPARRMIDAPKIGETPSTIDLDFSDASQWLPWAQSDWSGGFQEEKWSDNATYKIADNIDTVSKYGQITLQPNIVAVKTDFADGHTFGAAISFIGNADTESYILVGTQHAVPTACQLWKIDADDTSHQIITSWAANTLAVMDMDIYRRNVLIALDARGSGAACLQSYDGTTLSSLYTGYKIDMVKVISDRIYIGQLNFDTSLFELAYSDDGGTTFTTIMDNIGGESSGGVFRRIIKGCVSFATLYFLIQLDNKIEFWSCQDVYTSKIYEFPHLTDPDIHASKDGLVMISGKDEKGEVQIYIWTGSQLIHSFAETVDGLTCSPLRLTEHQGYIITQNLLFDGTFWFTHINAAISGGSVLIPFISFGTTTGQIYFYGTDSGSDLEIYRTGTGYAATGYVITGLFTGSKPAIDKLWYSVELDFKALAAGESIQVLYSIDNEATWTSLGTVSETGSQKYTFLFSNIVSRQIQLKIVLNGNGTTTPTLYDFVCRFQPIADERYQWSLSLKCFENMKLLDEKTSEPKRGIELRNSLLVAKETKQVVNFEDIDYFETQLSAAVNNAVTTISVDSTANAPEKGRFKIGDEWITYTGKTAVTFTGCTRGARGTIAATHSDDTAVANIYKVRVRSYQEIIPTMNESRAKEMFIAVNLEEA